METDKLTLPNPPLTPKCPRCGKRTIPIVYGEPTPETVQASVDGQVRLGGCLVDDHFPTRYCRWCKLSFNDQHRTPRTGEAPL